MAMYEEYKDNPSLKPKKQEKRYMHKAFRKAGKMMLDNAPVKYIGCKVWWY